MNFFFKKKVVMCQILDMTRGIVSDTWQGIATCQGTWQVQSGYHFEIF